MSKEAAAALLCSGVESYDEQIAKTQDWDVFYHLSSLRRAALSWLPIPGDAAVLELGCGFGALTGLLCEKAAQVDAVDKDPVCAEGTRRRYAERGNLRVIRGDVDRVLPERRYDMIVVVEFWESYRGDAAMLLKRLREHLAPGGRLLLGFRNRLALKYACGLTDEIVTEPGLAMDPALRLYTERQMRELAGQAGLAVSQVWYPMPDFAFTQAVWSGDRLPQESIRDRVMFYDPFGDGTADSVSRLTGACDAAITEGRFAESANVILLECTAEMPESGGRSITGAVLSADREPSGAFATVFFSDATVEKRPLLAAGAPALYAQAGNLQALRSRGLCTVPNELMEGEPPVLRMPEMAEQPLLEKIRSLLPQGREALSGLLERLYQEILASSDFSQKDPVLPAGEGPVLQTGYIDMIPYNAFWTGEKICWYDQEFTLDNCPAGYILYRALRYTWLHLPELEKVLPLAEAAANYGLTEVWDIYTRYEDAFTARNRRRETYAPVYRWAWGSKPYRTGFVMGTFDLFHEGHLNLLRRAKERCGFLRVGVLSDTLVRKYKGFTPNIPLAQRLNIVRAVRYVDEAVAVEGDYVSKIAEWYKRPYDCFFSGDDYAENEYWKLEQEQLKQLGAAIEFFPYTKEISSSAIRKIIEGGEPS